MYYIRTMILLFLDNITHLKIELPIHTKFLMLEKNCEKIVGKFQKNRGKMRNHFFIKLIA